MDSTVIRFLAFVSLLGLHNIAVVALSLEPDLESSTENTTELLTSEPMVHHNNSTIEITAQNNDIIVRSSVDFRLYRKYNDLEKKLKQLSEKIELVESACMSSPMGPADSMYIKGEKGERGYMGSFGRPGIRGPKGEQMQNILNLLHLDLKPADVNLLPINLLVPTSQRI